MHVPFIKFLIKTICLYVKEGSTSSGQTKPHAREHSLGAFMEGWISASPALPHTVWAKHAWAVKNSTMVHDILKRIALKYINNLGKAKANSKKSIIKKPKKDSQVLQ